MYKQKYYKYKNKYLDFAGRLASKQKIDNDSGFDDPDKFDAYDEDTLEIAKPEDDLPEDELFDGELDEKLDQMYGIGRGKFLGFDKDRGEELITEDLEQDIVDIGLYGKARGKLYEYNDFGKDMFISINDSKNKEKILMINDKDSFDKFTEEYGEIEDDHNLYIKWNIVSKNYKGFYLSSSSLGDRDNDIPYLGRTITTWVNEDYNFVDDVVIFTKIRELINSKRISKPFRGKIVDSYAIEDNEFVRITDQITNDKILLIDDVVSFDKFTNMYGVISKRKNDTYIDINWNEVNKDYDGFLIDKDNDFYDDRYEKAFYKNNLYKSWWDKNNIESGVVYIFE